MIVAIPILVCVALIVLCAILINGERFARPPIPKATISRRQRRDMRRNRADLRAALGRRGGG